MMAFWMTASSVKRKPVAMFSYWVPIDSHLLELEGGVLSWISPMSALAR